MVPSSGSTTQTGASGSLPSMTPPSSIRKPQSGRAFASSRRIEIDVNFLEQSPACEIHPSIRAFQLPGQQGADKQICLVNDGYPANFIPGSGSVADEVVELILGELIVLMADLTTYTYEPGIHRLATEGEAVCTKLWIEQRDQT